MDDGTRLILAAIAFFILFIGGLLFSEHAQQKTKTTRYVECLHYTQNVEKCAEALK